MNELENQKVQQLEAEPRLATTGKGCLRNHQDQSFGDTCVKLLFIGGFWASQTSSYQIWSHRKHLNFTEEIMPSVNVQSH